LKGKLKLKKFKQEFTRSDDELTMKPRSALEYQI